MNFTIVSSNIRYAEPQDKYHDWNYRKDLLVNILVNDNPCIISTQEGWYWQIRELEYLIYPYKLAEDHREWNKNRMYPCIFYDQKLIKVLNSGDLWLSETPTIPDSSSFDSAYPRLFTWIKGQIENTTFMLINVHFDHILESTRIEQAKVLSNQINRLNTENLPIILMGDFNDSPTSDTRKIIMNNISNLYDPWITKKLEEQTSTHFFTGETNGDRIDWILLNKSFKTTKIWMDNSYKENGCPDSSHLYPSDHYPVKCQITI